MTVGYYLAVLPASLVLAMAADFRPPSVPLVTHTPFFSCWSAADKLTDRWPTHWTGGTNAMLGLVRIDGKVYRWMGPNPNLPGKTEIPALEQASLRVTATRSIYTFRGGGIELTVEFCSPLIADDLDLLARPVTYLTLNQKATDGKAHSVTSYVDWTGEWVVEDTSQKIVAARHRLGKLEALSLRAADQRPLHRSGDRIRVDWGTLYVAGPGDGWIAGHAAARGAFVGGTKPEADDMRFPRAADDDWPVVAMTSEIGSDPQTFLIAYDEDEAMQFFKRPLRPYWNRREIGPTKMLLDASISIPAARQRSAVFDERLWKALDDAGGPEYAQMGSLAYRQCLAGHSLAEDLDGDLLMFSKENTSNGCIATVDVTFPASPFFLALNPGLLKAQVKPILEYASMPRWKFDFAPHDLGTHPLANGQVYGGGEVGEENQMPVEESANMLLMVAALCRQDKSGEFARPFASTLEKWAGYLEREGLDPDNQLCTDDFTGHLAHNANLSIKAICALRAYGEIAGLLGQKDTSSKYASMAKKLAGQWMKMAVEGDHTVLAFDKPGTWSQKYNLFWDKLLGYNLFPESLYRSELAWYKKKSNRFGLPLDNRAGFTKTDWLIWCASLAPTKSDFEGFASPVYQWLSKTPSRVAFTDWYETEGGETRGMHSRTVIGGIFAQLLMARGLNRIGVDY